jgi:hypothetical protein
MATTAKPASKQNLHPAAGRKTSSPKKAQEQREEAATQARKAAAPPDPLSPENLRRIGLRVGLPLLGLWIIVAIVRATWLTVVSGVITVALGGFVFWAYRQASKSRAVVDILKGADTKEGRKAAIERLETEFKKGDAQAIFGKAQLEMQEDPRKALATLEQIKLDRVMAPVADEARAQRAMIHLILGETDEARALVDPIDLGRHQEARSRATLTAIIAEAWARTGQAKRSVELLDKVDFEDEKLGEIRPQLLRARAFAHAWANDTKQMKNDLRLLKAINVQLLMGFVTKKKNPMGVSPRGVHPALEKEAFDMVMKSGMVPRRMEVRRG